MLFKFHKLLHIATFNFSMFLLLMIGIQNSSNQKSVNFIMGDTVALPIGFIVGVSFISGSLTGSFLTMNFKKEKR